MSDEVKLLPCGKCGSECRVETFGPNKTITEPLQLFICSNNKQFGGNCTSDRAYFGAPFWNQANFTRAIEATRPTDQSFGARAWYGTAQDRELCASLDRLARWAQDQSPTATIWLHAIEARDRIIALTDCWADAQTPSQELSHD